MDELEKLKAKIVEILARLEKIEAILSGDQPPVRRDDPNVSASYNG
jgi:hypothetical protein